MFTGIECISNRIVAGKRFCAYQLYDTCSLHCKRFNAPSSHYNDANVAVSIITLYKNRKVNIIKNLVKFYEFLHSSGYDINHTLLIHAQIIDKLDPTIGYKSKYYDLLRKVYLKKYL
jgi:hypothetical protein